MYIICTPNTSIIHHQQFCTLIIPRLILLCSGPVRKSPKELSADLYKAIEDNNVRLARSLITADNNLDVNLRVIDKDWALKTPLDVAADRGHAEMVELLVKVGKARPGIKDNYGFSPTYKAAQKGDLEVLKILVEDGRANVDVAYGIKGRTPLMEAIYKPAQPHIVNYLVPRTRNINAKNSDGYTCLFVATEGGNLEILRTLLVVGRADPDLKNGDGGWTVTMRASGLGSLSVLKTLIEEGGANPEIISDRFGKTALHYAAFNGRTAVVEYLINQARLNPIQKDENGQTPVYLAAQGGSLGVVKFLVEKVGVDINSKNGPAFNSIPLGTASGQGHDSTVRYLLNNGAKSHVNYLNLKTISPLYVAAEHGHTDVVKTLVEVGNANVEIRNTDKLWTAMHVAAYKGHLDIVQYLLLSAGANAFALTGDGRDTPLSLAEKNGQEGMVLYLTLISSPG